MHPLLRTGLIVLLALTPLSVDAVAARVVSSPFAYTYNTDGTLEESGSAPDSTSPYWWLNSGGYLIIDNGIGSTVHGALSPQNPWAKRYAVSNPLDTDGGKHPQNLFRLISRSSWNNVRVEGSYRVVADHFSTSPNRNQSNGLLLMSRYRDNGQTLYYAGLRVDGKAVIKKKLNGAYTTLAEKSIFPGSYAITSNVNLIPHNEWITLRTDTTTNSDGSVTVTLAMKRAGASSFTTLLSATDRSPIIGSGAVGIRTDFMDVQFESFKAVQI